MDAVTLDGVVGELRPRLVGRYLTRPRLASPTAVSFEVSGEKSDRLWLDVSRATAGLYRVAKDALPRLQALAAGDEGGRARQFLLHARKHADGLRVRDVRRVAGERMVVLDASGLLLVLALQAAPALALIVGGGVLSTLGDGAVPWPLPEDHPEREWDRVDAALVAASVRDARTLGRSATRAVLAQCPGLSPALVHLLDETPGSFDRLRASLRSARPTLVVPASSGPWHDRDLAGKGAMALLPGPLAGLLAKDLVHPASWLEAAATFLEARLRGQHFEALHKHALGEVRRELRRLTQLEAHLARDLASLPDESELRRDAEALLAASAPVPPGVREFEVADPYEPAKTRRVAVDPALSGPRNADRLYAKARRIDRARAQVASRLRETRTALAIARALEERVLGARDSADLRGGEARGGPGMGRPEPAREGGPRHYLTSRGLSLLVGRGARENHHLTFTVARPDDLWLHARDVPGAHVVVRDPEGRAAAGDLREAAEVAAFCSEARGESLVDVHVTRRKNVRPARGGAGRVLLGHTETLRVAPRDPEGRLRRR